MFNKKPEVIPDGMRWDQCTKRLKPIDNHKIIVVDTGWPETHVADLPDARYRRTSG